MNKPSFSVQGNTTLGVGSSWNNRLLCISLRRSWEALTLGTPLVESMSLCSYLPWQSWEALTLGTLLVDSISICSYLPLAKLRGTYALTLGMPLVESISVCSYLPLAKVRGTYFGNALVESIRVCSPLHLAKLTCTYFGNSPNRKYKRLLTIALGKVERHFNLGIPLVESI